MGPCGVDACDEFEAAAAWPTEAEDWELWRGFLPAAGFPNLLCSISGRTNRSAARGRVVDRKKKKTLMRGRKKGGGLFSEYADESQTVEWAVLCSMGE